MNDVMLDLETLGTKPDSTIISIGAVQFDLATREIGPTFYQIIDITTWPQFNADPATICWWMQQKAEARGIFIQAGTKTAYDVLVAFSEWVPNSGVRVWGNGAAFDNVILASAYRLMKLPQPWRWYNDRCYRTIKAQYRDVGYEQIGTAHNAVDDAMSQAVHLVNIAKEHGL